MELEKAFRTLELKPGATFKEVSEAREDLLILWDPRRLSDHPRLRTRAESKIREIHEAYGVVMEHLGHTGIRRAADSKAAGSGATSLFEEVFSARTQSPKQKLPFWVWIVATAIVLILIIGYVWLQQTTETQKIQEENPSTGSTEESVPESEAGLAPPLEPPPVEIPDSAASVPEAGGAAAPAGSGPSRVRKELDGPRTESATRPSDSRKDRPMLLRGEIQPPDPEISAESREAEEVERAVRILNRESTAAGSLTRGKTGNLHFSEWMLVGREGSELWIGRIAAESGGRPINFVWAVNLETQSVRPVSEAARDLEKVTR